MTFTETVNQQLSQPLEQSRVAKRQGGGGMSLSYLEGFDVIDTANAIFGYDGWSSAVRSVVATQYGYIATVAVLIGDVKREDSGFGIVTRDNGEGHEMAVKGAVTDALKRALRTFGDQFGNSLYSKDDPNHATHAQANRPQRAAPTTQAPTGVAFGGISDKQIAFARTLAKNAGIGDLDAYVSEKYGAAPAGLNKQQASALIEQLQGVANGGSAPTRPAPQRVAVVASSDVPF